MTQSATNSTQQGSPLPWEHGPAETRYAPLLDTLRLYTGWVSAWGIGVLALSAYAHTRALPFSTDFLDVFGNLSSLIVITASAFLFLFWTSLHKVLGRNMLTGILCLVVWAVCVFLVQQNI